MVLSEMIKILYINSFAKVLLNNMINKCFWQYTHFFLFQKFLMTWEKFLAKFLYVFSLSACRQLSRSVQGIFGPSDPILGAHIQSICEALDVPHLEARIDFETAYKEFSINLYPTQDHLNKAFRDVMNFLNWTKVAIIYEEDHGLLHNLDFSLSPFPLPPKKNNFFRTPRLFMRAMKSSKRQKRKN